jgi:hypothetical protein
VVADTAFIILRGIRIVVVVQNDLGIGVHEEAGQQGPMGTNGLLAALRGLDNGAVIVSPTVRGGDGGGIKGPKVGLEAIVLASHGVCRRQGASAAVQILEQSLRGLIRQELIKGAVRIKPEPRVIALSSTANLMAEGLDVRAIAGRDGFSSVALGDVEELAQDLADEIS